MLRLLIFLLCCSSAVISSAQEQSISHYIQEIEGETAFVFNYNVECTDTLYTLFDFNEEYSSKNIEAFFYLTALDITINENQIIILPLKKNEFELCATIKSANDNSLLPFANIKLNQNQGGQSDSNGIFKTRIKAYKNQVIDISYLGFKKRSFMVQELTDCDALFLSIDEDLLNKEIVITDYLTTGITEGKSFTSFDFNLDKVLKGNGIIEKDLLRKVQLLPGIYSPDDSAVNLNIRGSSADHNLVRWEGVTLYDTGHFFGMVSSINPYNVKTIKVYRSVHSASFENRIGGIIDLSLSEQIEEKPEFSLGLNLTEAHLNASIPIIKEKIQLIISGRRSLLEALEYSPTYSSYAKKVFQSSQVIQDEESEESENEDLILNYYDLNTKLIIKPTSKIKLQTSILSSGDRFKYTSAYPTNNLQSIDTLSSEMFALSQRISLQHNNQDLTTFSLAFSDYSASTYFKLRENNSNLDFYEKEIENKIKDFQIKLAHATTFKKHVLNFGYVFDQKEISFEFEETSNYQKNSEIETESKGIYHHIFLDDHLQFNKLSLQLGLRTSYARIQKEWRLSPRLALRYKIHPQLQLKASAGIFHQYLRQLYQTTGSELNLTNAIWILDDSTNSNFLNAKKISGGLVFKNSNWLLDLEAYYHLTAGLSAQNPNIKNEVILNDMGELSSKGIDILLSRKINQFKSTLHYSLSEQLVYFPFLNEDEKEYFSANTDQPHVLNWTNSYYLNHLMLTGSYQYRTGLPFTQSNEVIPIEDDEPEEHYEVGLERINGERLKDYHRFDIGIQYQHQWKAISFEVGMSVLNMLNRKNLLSRNYSLANTNQSSQEPEVLTLEKTQLPRTVLMHFRIYF